MFATNSPLLSFCSLSRRRAASAGAGERFRVDLPGVDSSGVVGARKTKKSGRGRNAEAQQVTLSSSGVCLADRRLSLGRKRDTGRQDRGILGMSREGQSGLQKADRAGASGTALGKQSFKVGGRQVIGSRGMTEARPSDSTAGRREPRHHPRGQRGKSLRGCVESEKSDWYTIQLLVGARHFHLTKSDS